MNILQVSCVFYVTSFLEVTNVLHFPTQTPDIRYIYIYIYITHNVEFQIVMNDGARKNFQLRSLQDIVVTLLEL
jgi:hypothetical protein